MKTYSFLVAASVFSVVTSRQYIRDKDAEALDTQDDGGNKTVHFYVLLVPDSTVQEIERARQEEGGVESVADTGVYVGQIISGVLGGDFRPIFAGSASFIGEPDVQQGVSTILAHVAPTLNAVLKPWVTRAQTYLGIPTTTTASPVKVNGTANSNSTISATTTTPQPLLIFKGEEDEDDTDVSKVIRA